MLDLTSIFRQALIGPDKVIIEVKLVIILFFFAP